MSKTAKPAELLLALRELNHLFLDYLADATDTTLLALGFPPAGVPTLRQLSEPGREVAATLPRALFQLQFAPRQPLPRTSGNTHHRLVATQLAIAHGARSLAIRAPFRARVLLGCGLEDIGFLCRCSLGELCARAIDSILLSCAAPVSADVWCALLASPGPQTRRELDLLALQPTSGGNRPVPWRSKMLQTGTR